MCQTKKCNNDDYALGLCRQCYQVARYWNERPLADKFKHVDKMQVRANNISRLTGNVRRMTG